MTRTLALIFISLLVACSREQTNSAVIAVSKTYNESYRDNVIKNYQARVANTPNCSEFREKLKIVGERYDNAVNGGFANDMIEILKAAKAANCLAS
jgi:hypothetical protein